VGWGRVFCILASRGFVVVFGSSGTDYPTEVVGQEKQPLGIVGGCGYGFRDTYYHPFANDFDCHCYAHCGLFV
jgi:hypothetical protein